MAKDLQLVLLLDYYGELLTPKQRSFLELYYCDDLSLAEIAEGEGITRQAVRDGIKRGEQILLELEAKLGIAQKHARCREALTSLCAHADALRATCHDAASLAHCAGILSDAAACNTLL